MGEANQKSNRFFDFSELTNHIIYYKPNKKVKIPISFYSNKLTDVNLKKLEELSKSNILPITVYLSTESVSLSFDEDILNNYNLGDNSLQTNKTDRKVILDKIQENKNNKTILLKKERTLGIDLNPQYIGCSVIEKIEGNNDEVKIIYKFCFDLSKFISKLPRKYSKEKRTYHNNKHKYEITQIIKQIVKIAKHYRCYSVSMEDLNFSVGDSGKGVYFNRITKNIWHREVIEQALSKQTNIHSLELRKVNPVYTSLIGNIKNNSFDPVNASIEIGRRGLLGFKKENIYICKYPTVDETVHTAVQSILKRNGDDSYEKRNISTWKGISTILKKYRYRWVLEEVKFSKMRMNTRKSKINKYIFE
jgi:IS605 OrfB family transposase